MRSIAILILFASVASAQVDQQPKESIPEDVAINKRLNPEQTVEAYLKAILARDKRAILNLFDLPIPDIAVALILEQDGIRGTKIVDKKVVGDAAMVITGSESPLYVKGIDLDAIRLRRKGGSWKLTYAFDEYPPELEAWYRVRAREIYDGRAEHQTDQ